MAIGLFLVVMPMMVSTVVRAFGWMILLGRNGVINSVSVDLGLGRWLAVMNTETAVVIALIQICLPLVVLPTMASMEKIPLALEEAATNLGAAPFQLFRSVLFPLAAPGIASGSLLAFVVAISVVVTPALMGGRTSRMIGNEIYDQVVTALNWPFASAMALVLILVALSVMGAGYGIVNMVQSRSRPRARVKMYRSSPALRPLLFSSSYSCWRRSSSSCWSHSIRRLAFRIPTSEFSLRWYEKFLGLAPFRDGLFLVSLPIAIAASVAATLLGTLSAIYLVRCRWLPVTSSRASSCFRC